MQDQNSPDTPTTALTTTEGALDLVKVAEVLPATIPDLLIINGVENSRDIVLALREKVFAMTVNGITDEAGYEAAKEQLKLISKTRTSEDKWRNQVSKPFRDFNTNLKARVDQDIKDYKDMEAHLEAQMKPVDDYIKLERERLEQEKDKLAEVRAEELVSMGGVFDGKGTYKFEHDKGIFFLADNLRTFSEEAYQEALIEIKESWQEYQNELEKERQAELERQKKANERVFNLRLKELKFEGFNQPSPGVYVRGEITLREEDILNMEDEAWDEMINPTPAAVEQPAEKPSTPFEQAIAEQVPATEEVTNPFANDDVFEEMLPSEEESNLEEEAESHIVDTVINILLSFSDEKPFVEFQLNAALMQRIFVEHYRDKALEGLPQHSTGQINESLFFVVYKK